MWAPEDADEAGRDVGGGKGGGGEGGGESSGSKGSGGRDAGGDERLSVLRMLEAGKITAAEAVRLLEALEAGAGPGHGPGRRAAASAASAASAAGAASADEPRLIRVRMNDLRTGRPRLNLNMPFGLLGLVVDVAERFAARSGAGAGAEEISAARVLAELRSGVRGKVLDIEDEEHAVRLEVFVD